MYNICQGYNYCSDAWQKRFFSFELPSLFAILVLFHYRIIYILLGQDFINLSDCHGLLWKHLLHLENYCELTSRTLCRSYRQFVHPTAQIFSLSYTLAGCLYVLKEAFIWLSYLQYTRSYIVLSGYWPKLAIRQKQWKGMYKSLFCSIDCMLGKYLKIFLKFVFSCLSVPSSSLKNYWKRDCKLLSGLQQEIRISFIYYFANNFWDWKANMGAPFNSFYDNKQKLFKVRVNNCLRELLVLKQKHVWERKYALGAVF